MVSHGHKVLNLHWSTLVQGCRLFGIKPLTEPMMTYCQLHPDESNSLKSELKYNFFFQENDGLLQERRKSSALAMELRLSCTKPSKLYLLNDDHFVPQYAKSISLSRPSPICRCACSASCCPLVAMACWWRSIAACSDTRSDVLSWPSSSMKMTDAIVIRESRKWVKASCFAWRHTDFILWNNR